MLDRLPDDILQKIIIDFCKLPSDYIICKSINKGLNKQITSMKNMFLNKENNYEDNINYFCNRRTPISIFKWFFENDINFTLLNIKQLIISNRSDVFCLGYHYSKFLKILFNRFNMNVEQYSDIFNLVESSNPLIIAGKYNRINIIKLLVEKSTIGNPFIKLIPDLLDLSIKYNNKNLLSYMVVNHMDKIETIINEKLLTIIHRINNCEDILFYLIKTQKIQFHSEHDKALIMKKYNQLFKHIHEKSVFSSLYFDNLLNHTVNYQNIEIFDYLFKKNDVKINDFNNLIFEYVSFEKKDLFFKRIINTYVGYFSKTSNLIKISIINEISQSDIIEMVNNNYHFTHEDMELALENKMYFLLKNMCQLFH